MLEGATFYSQIFRQQWVATLFAYCDSVVCHITGYQGLEAEIINNIRLGQTTADGRFTLLPTCKLLAAVTVEGPTMMIDDDTHSYVQPENIQKLLEQYP